MKLKWFRKSLSCLTCLLYFVSQDCAYAAEISRLSIAPQSPESRFYPRDAFSIPSEWGSLQELQGNSPQVVLIQDAHGRYEAQRNTASILDFLNRKTGIANLFLEGGAGKLDPERLQFFNEPQFNKAAVDLLAREAEAGGAEIFLTEQRHRVAAYGLEDPKLYLQNFEAFRKVMEARPETEKFLETELSGIRQESGRLLQADLKAFFKEWMNFESSQDLARFLNPLAAEAKKRIEIDLNDPRYQLQWPQLIRFFELKKREPKLRPDEALKELKTLSEWTKRTGMPKPFLEFLETLSRKGRGQIDSPFTSLRHFWESFYEAAHPRGFAFEQVPNLAIFEGYQVLQEEMDSQKLFEEINQLTGQVFEKLAKGDKEKELFKRARRYFLLKKLFHLQLTRREFQELEKKAPTFRDQVPAQNFHSARLFYYLARKREESMLSVILGSSAAVILSGVEDLRGKPDAGLSVLITGGFHTQALVSALKKQGISYAVVSPHFSETGSDEKYIAAMTGAKPKLDFDAVSAVNSALSSPPPVNVIPAKAGIHVEDKLQRESTTLMQSTWMGEMQPPEIASRRAEVRSQIENWGLAQRATLKTVSIEESRGKRIDPSVKLRQSRSELRTEEIQEELKEPILTKPIKELMNTRLILKNVKKDQPDVELRLTFQDEKLFYADVNVLIAGGKTGTFSFFLQNDIRGKLIQLRFVHPLRSEGDKMHGRFLNKGVMSTILNWLAWEAAGQALEMKNSGTKSLSLLHLYFQFFADTIYYENGDSKDVSHLLEKYGFLEEELFGMLQVEGQGGLWSTGIDLALKKIKTVGDKEQYGITNIQHNENSMKLPFSLGRVLSIDRQGQITLISSGAEEPLKYVLMHTKEYIRVEGKARNFILPKGTVFSSRSEARATGNAEKKFLDFIVEQFEAGKSEKEIETLLLGIRPKSISREKAELLFDRAKKKAMLKDHLNEILNARHGDEEFRAGRVEGILEDLRRETLPEIKDGVEILKAALLQRGEALSEDVKNAITSAIEVLERQIGSARSEMRNDIEAVERVILEHKLFTVIRAKTKEDGLARAREAIEGGARLIEVSVLFPSPKEAMEIIHTLRQENGPALIGAGTIRTREEAQQALDSGAQFLTSPVYDPSFDLAAFAREKGVLGIPGGHSEEEAARAEAAGIDFFKIFPFIIKDWHEFIGNLRIHFPELEGMSIGTAGLEKKVGEIALPNFTALLGYLTASPGVSLGTLILPPEILSGLLLVRRIFAKFPDLKLIPSFGLSIANAWSTLQLPGVVALSIGVALELKEGDARGVTVASKVRRLLETIRAKAEPETTGSQDKIFALHDPQYPPMKMRLKVLDRLGPEKRLYLTEDMESGARYVVKKLVSEEEEEVAEDLAILKQRLSVLSIPPPYIYDFRVMSAGKGQWAGLDEALAVIYPFEPGISLENLSNEFLDSPLGKKGLRWMDIIIKIARVARHLEELKVPGVWDFNPHNIVIRPIDQIHLIDYQIMGKQYLPDPIARIEGLFYYIRRHPQLDGSRSVKIEETIAGMQFLENPNTNQKVVTELAGIHQHVQNHDYSNIQAFIDDLLHVRELLRKELEGGKAYPKIPTDIGFSEVQERIASRHRELRSLGENRPVLLLMDGPAGAGKSDLLQYHAKRYPGRQTLLVRKSYAQMTEKIQKAEGDLIIVEVEDADFFEKETGLKADIRIYVAADSETIEKNLQERLERMGYTQKQIDEMGSIHFIEGKTTPAYLLHPYDFVLDNSAVYRPGEWIMYDFLARVPEGAARSEARAVELETIERVFEGPEAVEKLIQSELKRLEQKKIVATLASIEEDLRSLLDRTQEGQFMKMLEAGNQPVEEIIPDFSALAKAVLFRWHFDRSGLITQAMNQTEKFIKEEFPSLIPEVRREFNFMPGPSQDGTYQITLRFPGQKNRQGSDKFLQLTLIYKPLLYQAEAFLEQKTQGHESSSPLHLRGVEIKNIASLQNGIKALLKAVEEKRPWLKAHFPRRSETRAVKISLRSDILDRRENFFELMMYLRKMIGFYVLTEPDQEKWTDGLLEEFMKTLPSGMPPDDFEKRAIQHALWLHNGDSTRTTYALFGYRPTTRLGPLLKKYGLQAKKSREQISRASSQPLLDLKISAEDLLNRSAQLKTEAQSSGVLTVDHAARAVFLFSQAVRQALDPKDAAGLLPMESTLENVFSHLRGQAPAVPVSDSHKPSVMALTRYLNALSGNKFQEPDWAGQLAPKYQDSLQRILGLLGITVENRSEIRTDHRDGEGITRKNASEVLKPNWWIKDPKGKVGVIKQVTGSFKGKKANGQIHVVFLNDAGFQEKAAVLGAFFLLEAPETDEKQRFYLATKEEIDVYKEKLRTASREYGENKSAQIEEKEKKTAGLWHELAEWTPYDSPYWWNSRVFKTNLDLYRKSVEARRAGIYDLENASIVERKLLYELLGAQFIARGPKGLQSSALAEGRSEARAAKRQGRAGEETPLPETPPFRIDSILQSYSKDFILWAEDPEYPGRPNPAVSRYDFRAGETHPHKVEPPQDPSDPKGFERFKKHELRVQRFLKAVQAIRDRAAEILSDADRMKEKAFKTNDMSRWAKAAEWHEKAEAMKRRADAFGRSTTVIVVHAPTYLFSGESRDGVYHVGRRSVAYFPARYIDSLRLDRPRDMEKLAFFLDRAQRRIEPLEKGLKEVEAGTLPSRDVMKYVPESFEEDDRLFIRNGDFAPIFRRLDILSKRDAAEKPKREKEIERLQKGISRIEEIFNLLGAVPGRPPQKAYLPRLARWFDLLLHSYSAEGMQSPDSRFDLFNQSEILKTMLGHVERNESLPTRDELDPLARLYGILAQLQENVGQHGNALRSYRAQIDVWKEIQRGPDTAPYPLQLQEQVIRAFLKLGLYDDFGRELNVYLTGHGFPRKLYRLDRQFLAHSFILPPAFEAELAAILDSQLEFSIRSKKHTPEFEQRIMTLKKGMADGFKEARKKIENGTWKTETTESFEEMPAPYSVVKTAEQIILLIEIKAATAAGKGAFQIAGFSSRGLTPRKEYHLLGERIRGHFRTGLFSKKQSNTLHLIVTPGKIRLQEAGVEAFWFESPVLKNGNLAPYTQIQASPMILQAGYTDSQKIADRKFLQSLLFFIQQKELIPQKDLASFIPLLPAFRSEARMIDPRVARQVREDLILAAPLLKEGWVVAVHSLNQFKGKLEKAQKWLGHEPAANVLAFVKKHEPAVTPANFNFSFPGKTQKQFSDLIVAAMEKIVEARSHEPLRENDKILIDLLKTQERFVAQEMENVFSRSPLIYVPLEPLSIEGKKISSERTLEILILSLLHERMHALADSHPSRKYFKRALSVAGNHFWGQPLFEKFYESVEKNYPDLPRNSDDFAEEFWMQLFYPSAQQTRVDPLRALIRGRLSQFKTIQKTFEMLDEIHDKAAVKVTEDIDAISQLKIWDLLGIDDSKDLRQNAIRQLRLALVRGERWTHLKGRAERGEEIVGFIKLFEELAHRKVSIEDRTGDLHFELRTADVGQLAYLTLLGKPEALIAYSGVELEEDADFPEDQYPITLELNAETRKIGALYITIDKEKQESLKLEILIRESNEMLHPLEIDSIKNIEELPLDRLSLRATLIQGAVDSARSEARSDLKKIKPADLEILKNLFEEERAGKSGITPKAFHEQFIKQGFAYKTQTAFKRLFDADYLMRGTRQGKGEYPYSLSEKGKHAAEAALRSDVRKIPAKSSSSDSILAVSLELTNKILASDLREIEKFYALLFPEVFAPKELINKEARAKLVSAYAQLLPGGAAVVIPAKLLLGLSEQARQEYFSILYEGIRGSEDRPFAQIVFAGEGAMELKEKMSAILKEYPQLYQKVKINPLDEVTAAQNEKNHPVSVSFTEAKDHRAMDSRIPSLLLPSDEIKNLSESQRFEYLNKLTQLQLLAAQELKQPLKGEALEIALIRLMRKLNIEFDTKGGFLSPSTGSLLAADLTQAIAATKLTARAA